MATWVGLILVALGVAVLLFGKRTFILFSGIGALLGTGLLRIVPGEQTGTVALLVIFGLAIVGFFLGFFIKSLSHLLMAIIGFIAGGAITLAVLDSLGLNFGLLDFLLALLGGGIGWVLANRFFDLVLIIVAALTGALLVTRGLQFFSATFAGTVGSLIGLVLAVFGFIYLARDKRK